MLSPPYLNSDRYDLDNTPNLAPSPPQFPSPKPVSAPVVGFQSGTPKSSVGRAGLHIPSSSSMPLMTNPSRKRSREEFHASDDDSTSTLSTNHPSPVTPEEPIYGEGMMLLNPRTSLALSAESQTGTWFEEKAETHATTNDSFAVASGSRRMGLPSRKSQRLDTAATGWDDITAATIQRKLESSMHPDTYRFADGVTTSLTSASSGPHIPPIDDATRLLGISWQRVSTEDKDMAAAVRGWAKYINNHFSQFLCNAEILLKHRGLNAYLVTARPTNGCLNNSPAPVYFYLFNEHLTEGQLVGTNWQTCLQNLRSSPITFEIGSETMRATDGIPEQSIENNGILNGANYMNGSGNGMGNDGMDMVMDIDQ